MKKLLFCVCCLLILSGCDISCDVINGSNFKKPEGQYFGKLIPIEYWGHWSMVYHEETKVIYITNTDGEFEALLNSDGSPMLYEAQESEEE